MKAITTRYVGAGNTRGSAIIAKTEGNKAIRVHYDDALSPNQNHAQAVKALCAKMGNDSWKGTWIGSTLPDGKTEVWICEHRNVQQVTIS